MSWIVAIAAGIAGAFLQYGWNGPRRVLATPVPVALRAAVFALVVGLLLNAPAGRSHRAESWVALDVSESMTRGGDSTAWRAAVDTIKAVGPDSVFVFGDSLRRSPPPAHPADLASDIDPVVQRALATGRPMIVVTDGELPMASELRQLPAGSRLVVVPHVRRLDAAAVALDIPRAIVSGDTVEAQLMVGAGGAGSRAGVATLSVDGRLAAREKFDSLGAYEQRQIAFRVPISGAEGPALVTAVVSAPGDVEPANDTLRVGIDLARQPGAVFVSTSPDYDARYAVAVLRGALALPTRAFYYLSPGNWRVDGSFASVTQAQVRAAFQDAPVAILHGDTSVFGPPREATRAPLALIVPTQGDGNEWYANAAPVSPLSGALAGVEWDSLPPLLVGAGPESKGQWRGLEARRGREALTRTIIAGDDSPRRVVVVAASDLWRWEFRGGASADVFTALWGSIFDYLAAQRTDRRAAVPDARLFRADEPIRWRQGAVTDSDVTVVLTRRVKRTVDTLRLRFTQGSATAQSPPLPAGVYDVAVHGGAAVLAVNASAEWIPQPPGVVSERIGGAAPSGTAPSSRETGWVYVLLLAVLCAEWLMRRRAGLR